MIAEIGREEAKGTETADIGAGAQVGDVIAETGATEKGVGVAAGTEEETIIAAVVTTDELQIAAEATGALQRMCGRRFPR